MQEALNEGECRQPRLLPETVVDIKKHGVLYAVLMELPTVMVGTDIQGSTFAKTCQSAESIALLNPGG